MALLKAKQVPLIGTRGWGGSFVPQKPSQRCQVFFGLGETQFLTLEPQY